MPILDTWNGLGGRDSRVHQEFNKVHLMCAIMVIQSIADGAPYLAALGDVEACVTKLDPVYLC